MVLNVKLLLRAFQAIFRFCFFWAGLVKYLVGKLVLK